MFDGLKKVGSAFVEKVGNVGKSTAIIGLTAILPPLKRVLN